jgi:excisionase family DNA binding protein
MTKKIAAEYSGRSVRSLERLIAGGHLPARRDGRRVLVLKKDLDKYLSELPVANPNDVDLPRQ